VSETYTKSTGDARFLRELDTLIPVVAREIAALRELHLSKGRDYADEGDPLRNYATSAEDNGIPAWRAAQCRLSEKYHRMVNLTKDGAPDPEHESLDDTYRDLGALALIILSLRKRVDTNR
jgi:hypothetical protein